MRTLVVCIVLAASVLGCDGVTYESDCWRRAARTSKQSEGACP